MASGARSQDFFGQFRGFFKEFEAKRGGRAPPPPLLDPRLTIVVLFHDDITDIGNEMR